MIKFILPDGRYVYYALQAVHSVFRADNEDAPILMARATDSDGAILEFEIKGFELVRAGAHYE